MSIKLLNTCERFEEAIRKTREKPNVFYINNKIKHIRVFHIYTNNNKKKYRAVEKLYGKKINEAVENHKKAAIRVVS